MDVPSEGVLREWSPLTNLLQQIPQKAQRGLFTQDLNFTCIDVISEFIAIGTNVGLVYWYDRKTEELQRLRCEDNSSTITCVKAVSTVDYMVAAGSQQGVVTVFQVPKVAIGETVLPTQNKQVERYSVSGLHMTQVTAVEWSLNGMKLFSGDKNGIVVLTQIDFYMHLSKSSQLLDEKFEVVQLSYSQQLLLVSSLLRTILCHPDAPHQVAQVGQRERKTLGQLGATFCTGTSGLPHEQLVYSCRPGLRVWVADRQGVVHQTLIFKDALLRPRLHVQLMNPAPPHILRSRSLTRSDSLPAQGTKNDSKVSTPTHFFAQQFGRLSVFRDRLLVTSCGNTLYVLDPQGISVVATADELRCILDVATTKDEIFVLEGNRSLLRLAYEPEPLVPASTATAGKSEHDRLLSPSESHMSATAVSSLKDLTNKIPFQKFFSRLTPVSTPASPSVSHYNPQQHVATNVLTADEALELPPVVVLHDQDVQLQVDSKIHKDQQNRFRRASAPMHHHFASRHLLDSIGQQEFEEVLFKPSRTRRKKKSRKPVLISGTESGSDTMSSASALSAEGSEDWGQRSLRVLRSPSPSSDDTLGGPPCQPLPLPDLRSPDSIERDVAEKEWKLAEVLGDLLCIEKTSDEQRLKGNSTVTEECSDSTSTSDKNKKLKSLNLPLNESVANKKQKEIITQVKNDYSSFTLPSTRGRKEHTMTTSTSHPSLETNASTLLPVTGKHPLLQMPAVIDKTDRWVQYSLLEPVSSITVSKKHVCCVGPQDAVRYSSLGDSMGGLQWHESEWRAQDVRLTPDSSMAWRVHRGVAFRPIPCEESTDIENQGASLNPFVEQQWSQEARGVKALAVTDNGAAWIVTADCSLQYHGVAGESVTSIPSDFPVARVTCLGLVVWVVTAGCGQLWQRAGVSKQQPVGTHWLRIHTPGSEPVIEAVLGTAKGSNNAIVGWVVDRKYSIHFSCDAVVTSEEKGKQNPFWWQVLVSNYIFQQTSPLENLRSKIMENLSQQSEPIIAATETSVWISSKTSTCVYMNNTEFVGHRWDILNPTQLPQFERWQSATAEGSFEDKGQQWFLTTAGELHCARPNSSSFHAVSPAGGESVVCLAASPHSLWVLDAAGRVMIRQGLCDASPSGHGWKELDLAQIKPLAHFVHVTCGVDAAWACDKTGAVYMAVGSAHAMNGCTFSPCWLPVEGSPVSRNTFVKVFAGPESYMVWALDNKGNVYVREAVFPDFPVGISWVLVTGIEAVHLSISATGVWALCPKGGIYRRYGISENNYIGDYWKKIPGAATNISVSVDDQLWAIGRDGRLLVHSQKVVALASVSADHKTSLSHSSDSDWEVV